MRSAGVVMNDYADRHFDLHVERTKNRPLTAGIVSEREALLLAGGVTLCAFLLILPLHRLVWGFVGGGAVPRRELSAHQALPGDPAGLPRRWPSASASRWPSPRSCTTVPPQAWDDAIGEHLLGHRLRHLLRHGGPRRRPEDRHQDFGHHLRPLRRSGGDGQLRDDAGDPRLGRARRRDAASSSIWDWQWPAA
jgi:hypothetical protein